MSHKSDQTTVEFAHQNNGKFAPQIRQGHRQKFATQTQKIFATQIRRVHGALSRKLKNILSRKSDGVLGCELLDKICKPMLHKSEQV
jgi:hypothetical protein